MIRQFYNVLHIDDDIEYQSKLKESLETHKINVDVTNSFQSAKKEFFSHNFDAIILEYNIDNNNQSGLDFLEEVRNYNQKVTIIVLTNFINQDIVIKAIRLNVDDFVPKTTDILNIPDVIISRIEKRGKIFNKIIEETPPDVPLKGNLFQNFLILKGSIPLIIIGNWNDVSTENRKEVLTDNEFLMSGFLAAIQNFSANFFGQSVEEISLANSKLILISKDDFTACLKIENNLYRSMYTIENKRILINTLERILSEIIFYYKNNNDLTLLESTKNHINHILTESSIKTQLNRKLHTTKKTTTKKSYFKKLKETFSGKKISV